MTVILIHVKTADLAQIVLMATLVVVYKDTLVKIVKQVYLNVFQDSSFNLNWIYDDYWHKTLFCHHLSLIKTKQFFVIRTPDLKQEGIIC